MFALSLQGLGSASVRGRYLQFCKVPLNVTFSVSPGDGVSLSRGCSVLLRHLNSSALVGKWGMRACHLVWKDPGLCRAAFAPSGSVKRAAQFDIHSCPEWWKKVYPEEETIITAVEVVHLLF